MIWVNTILDHIDTLRVILPRYEGSWMVSETLLFLNYTHTTPLVSKKCDPCCEYPKWDDKKDGTNPTLV